MKSKYFLDTCIFVNSFNKEMQKKKKIGQKTDGTMVNFQAMLNGWKKQ